jgi:hypothetical protein
MVKIPDLIEFKNGPLPRDLKAEAYVTPDGSEFALNHKGALEYLRWCEELGIQVLGFDAWIPGTDGPIVQPQFAFEGDAEGARREIAQIKDPNIFFNIWVKKTASLP